MKRVRKIRDFIFLLTEITVKATETVPAAPEVNEVTDQDTKVTGKAKADSKVTVKVGTKELGTSQADQTGAYSIDIPKQAGG
ncbi:Ig-like domain-containing protein, partial [Bacillus cereus]|uniref:Ig-like domain-containing protein n=1 Tax=Bacillus cereus TaxID=1396 RepID=UPI000BFACAA2